MSRISNRGLVVDNDLLQTKLISLRRGACILTRGCPVCSVQLRKDLIRQVIHLHISMTMFTSKPALKISPKNVRAIIFRPPSPLRQLPVLVMR